MSNKIGRIKQRILENGFVNGVRCEMQFDEPAYAELAKCLEELALELRGAEQLDRELALYLYEIPKMIRNAYLSFEGHGGSAPVIAGQLEDAWVDLDALVMSCLVDSD